MGIIPGRLAMVHRSDERLYAEGVHFLARIIQELLCLAFFYRRLGEQMASGNLKGIDYEQARFSQIACFDTIAVNIAKLIENRGDTWNFSQLMKEWRRYVRDPEAIRAVQASIAKLRSSLGWVQECRHEKAAHQSKDDELTTLTVLPANIDFLAELLRTMDMFVDGPIPYTLHLHESGENIDLRQAFHL